MEGEAERKTILVRKPFFIWSRIEAMPMFQSHKILKYVMANKPVLFSYIFIS